MIRTGPRVLVGWVPLVAVEGFDHLWISDGTRRGKLWCKFFVKLASFCLVTSFITLESAYNNAGENFVNTKLSNGVM